MNERIKELAEQAGGYVSLSHEHDGKLILSGEYIVQKFAELIVKECISVADKESERYSKLDQEYCSMAMDNYRELVRKHFGVKE